MKTQIKNLVKTAFLMLVTVTIFSCSKKEDEPAPPSIYGKWEFDKYNNRISNDGDPEVLSPEINYIHEAACNKDYLIINTNNTSVVGSHQPNCQNTLEVKCDDIKFDGKKMILNWGVSDGTATILNLTATDLIFESRRPEGGLLGIYKLKRVL